MISQLFKWLQACVILLDFQVKGRPAKAVYNPKCVRIAVPKWYAAKIKLVPQKQVNMTVASDDKPTTLTRGVFNCLQIKSKDTISHLPVVFLPRVGFEVLLEIYWINSVGVCLDVIKWWLLNKDHMYVYQQSSFSKVPLHPKKVAVYAKKGESVPPGS